MREILFRGYDKKNKTWRKGSLLILNDTTYCTQEDYDKHPDNTKYYIVFQEMTDWELSNKTFKAEVEKDSIGQYTGYKDKNGNEIFEGDVINWDVDYYGLIEYWEDRFRIVPEALDLTDYLLKDIAPICIIVNNSYEDPRILKE